MCSPSVWTTVGFFSFDFVIILTQFLVNRFSHVTSQWQTFFPQTDVLWHDTESGTEQSLGFFYTFSKFLHGYPDLPSGSGNLSDLLKVPVCDYRWSYQLWEKVTNVKNVQFSSHADGAPDIDATSPSVCRDLSSLDLRDERSCLRPPKTLLFCFHCLFYYSFTRTPQ